MIPRTNKELHRLEDNHNDWDSVPVTKLSYWQRLAKKTNGFLTPGNAITLIGTVLVIDGLVDFAAGNRIIGTIKVVTGRVSDILDGIVAARTRTKGRIGRDLDPTADIMQLIIGVALLGHAKILPLFLIIFVGAIKTFGVLGSLAARARHVSLNPTAAGKIGTLFLWVGIGLFMLQALLMHHNPGLLDYTIGILGRICGLIGAILSIPATIKYMRSGFGAIKDKE